MPPAIIAAFVFGLVCIAALLAIAILIPRPTNEQMFIFRVVLAIAAGGVGAVIPGFFDIQGEVLKFTLQAGGALALFVIIFLINPPSLVPKDINSKEISPKDTDSKDTSPTFPSPKPPVKIKVPPHSRKETAVDSASSSTSKKDERSST